MHITKFSLPASSGHCPHGTDGNGGKGQRSNCTRSQEIKRTQECLAPSPKSNPLNYDTFDTRIGMDYVGDSFIYI